MRRVGLIFLVFLLSITSVNCVEYSLLATVTVNPVYSLSLEVKALKKEVWPGRDLPVSVSLSKTSLNVEKEKRITVELEYEVTNDTDVLTSGNDTIDVRKKKTKVIKIPIPTDAGPGMYTVKVTASHPHSNEAVDLDEFWVKEKIVKFGFMLAQDFWEVLRQFLTKPF